MTADYTFVNERLARHYGIPNVFGSDFRRVPLTDEARRGLLGKGAVLLVTSHADDDLAGAARQVGAREPPRRAATCRRRRICDRRSKTDPPGSAPKTMREQMEQHRTNPVCASCHQTMDPIGFALENFDVVGAWRTQGSTPGCRSTRRTCWPTARRSTAWSSLRAGAAEAPGRVRADVDREIAGLCARPRPHRRGHADGAKDRARRRNRSSIVSQRCCRASSTSAPFQMRMLKTVGG